MGKILQLSESKLKNFIEKIIEQTLDINELTLDELRNSPRTEALRNAINKNKIIGVAFVKDDGSVRAMCFRKYLKSYISSNQPKTENQSSINERFNMINVIDLNVYNKLLRENGGDKESAAKKSWRKIKLENALGFVAGREFVDLREENNILQRFGENVYNSLTKSMVKIIEQNQQENAAAQEEHGIEDVENPENGVLNIQEMIIKNTISKYLSNKK